MGASKTDLSSTEASIADLLDGVKSMGDCQSLMKDVFKRVAERALQAEMTLKNPPPEFAMMRM